MRLADYTQKREQERLAKLAEFRPLCLACFRPDLTCYCHLVKKFDPKIQFLILIQWREAEKRIATGRISHLSLENSQLIPGYNYTTNAAVNAALADPTVTPVVLYPGPASTNLSRLPAPERERLFPPDKKLAVFVIDGTWTTARKIVNRSLNLCDLPRICFDPPHPSNYRLRKQPKPYCFSTVEAIHHTIELLGASRGFDVESRRHDALLHVFNAMVDQQLALAKERYKPRFVRAPGQA